LGQINFKILAKVHRDSFKGMTPVEQYNYVIEHIDNPEILKELFLSAKDDIIRLKIVEATRDPDLAKRLFKNTKYLLVKASLIAFINDQDLIRDMLISYVHSPEILTSIMERLTEKQNRALIQSMKKLNVLPKSFIEIAEKYIKGDIKGNLIVD